MLLDAIIGVVVWIVDSSMSALSAVIPGGVWDLLDGFTAALVAIMTAGPVGALGMLFVAHGVLDLALNAFVFGIRAYQLIPFKAS